ncbi:hypothetical protein MASR1M8_08780 [Thermomonas brevis]
MHPALQVTLAVLATLAAIASAVSAWKAQTAAREALNFQKRLSKHQDSLFLLRSTIISLWQLKRVIGNPMDASDDEFGAIESLHRQVKDNLDSLALTGVVPPRRSMLFAARSLGEIVDQMPVANGEIDLEIKRLQSKIDEIFS